MKVKNVIEDLKDKKFIDENEIYVYASLNLYSKYEKYPRKSRIIWW